ncbi:RHS repeat-associated core domain-containing protein [Streptomyces hyaluromycini]|uniref:RHS repeat-associated core domain-containing protein n=1 Tax=Streptomyces hyaluromycini TaxID=1377993 RepID=A0ABV1WRH0_9ACTN
MVVDAATQTADANTGLTHIGARAYEPAIGRSLSADPVFAADDHKSLNGCACADNTPVTKSDPSGPRPITASEHDTSQSAGRSRAARGLDSAAGGGGRGPRRCAVLDAGRAGRVRRRRSRRRRRVRSAGSGVGRARATRTAR